MIYPWCSSIYPLISPGQEDAQTEDKAAIHWNALIRYIEFRQIPTQNNPKSAFHFIAYCIDIIMIFLL